MGENNKKATPLQKHIEMQVYPCFWMHGNSLWHYVFHMQLYVIL